MAARAREDAFTEFFKTATGGFAPYRWQIQVALDGLPDVLPVPTGLGKTEVALVWAWRRLVEKQPEPLHLVVCLPMRSLVTQTVQRLGRYFDALRAKDPELAVGVHQLMGGAIDEKWVRWPDKPWILVGTQDQLLSRALNRGYTMSRFEWPVHFGLLNNDCRWLIDEVQLMGPGLWTTSQLDWMRRTRFPSLKPCLTMWMSATVGTSFLSTSDRRREGRGESSAEQAAFETKLKACLDTDPSLSWWRAAKRPVEWWKPEKPGRTGKAKRSNSSKESTEAAVTSNAIALAVVKEHREGTLTLVICNTVDMARNVFRALSVTHKILLTSRFRRQDRSRHEQRLLNFDADRKADKLPENDPGLICVSTQVIEAGVDVSAHRLWSELAPWPSMVQRLGRLNRKGDDQAARASVWETPKESRGGKTDRIGPYKSADIGSAKKLVEAFSPISQSKPFANAIAEMNKEYEKDVRETLRPKESPLPRALDVHGLFSTERDVHGGFTDVSAFVRGTDPDVDVTVFWRNWPGDAPPRGDECDGPPLDPASEGCSVPSDHLKKMLERDKGKAWLWDEEADRWEHLNPWDIRPGMLIMLKRDVGGYDTTEGWAGDKANVLADVPRVGRGQTLRDDSWTDIGYWSRLDVHLADACREADSLCDRLGFDSDSPYRKALVEGAKLHDIGKAYPPWQGALPDRSGMPGLLLAKTPHLLFVDVDAASDVPTVCRWIREHHPEALRLTDRDWRRGRGKGTRLRWAVDQKLRQGDLDVMRALRGACRAGHEQFRPGLRHEAASALAMSKRYRDDPAGYPCLAVYLVATHHGKVRTVLRSTRPEGDDVFGVRPDATVLEVAGQRWPMDFSVAKDGAEGRWEGNEFVLTGHGWTGLVADLLGPWRPEEKGSSGVVPTSEPRHLGPFALAYLEALIRVVDWRASEKPSESIKPSEVRRGG